MKTFFSICALVIAANCAAQSPSDGITFHFTPPDSAYLARVREEEKLLPPPLVYVKTAYKRVIPDSAMALAHFLAVERKVCCYYDDSGFDVEEQTLIFYHVNGWHNPRPDKINPADDSDVIYADEELQIYENRGDKELYFDFKLEDRVSAVPLKSVIQFLEK